MTEKQIEIIKPSFKILDDKETKELRVEILDLVQNKQPKIILVDLEEVVFMDSAGLGGLVAILKQVRLSGSEFCLCSLSEQIKIIFDLTKMGNVFKIFASYKEFQEKLGSIEPKEVTTQKTMLQNNNNMSQNSNSKAKNSLENKASNLTQNQG